MRRGLIAVLGGLAAVGGVYGVFWLGEHSPDWLAPAFVLLAVFIAGSSAADALFHGEPR